MRNMATTTLYKEKNYITDSKYLKTPRESLIFKRVSVLYLFAYYVLPPYWGIPTPGFDLTVLRIMLIIAAMMTFGNYKRFESFFELVKSTKVVYVLVPYVFVTFYTMVFRIDYGTFLNPFLEIVEFVFLFYMIKETLGLKETVRLVIVFIWILAILGIVEGIIGDSPFAFYRPLKGLYSGRYIRGGSYRIMSNCVHALGYGLVLVTMIPFSGYDFEKDEFNIFRRPILLALLMINVFLNGSRSTLGLAFAEIGAMFIFSDKKYLKKNLLFVSVFAVFFGAFLFGGQGTPLGKYILLQITTVIDTFFGTQLSVKYGANLALLRSSSAYRDQLKGIFGVKWLNPVLGLGRNRRFRAMVNGHKINSVDSYYIAEYVRYAYPGMLSYILFLAFTGLSMLRDVFKSRSALLRVIMISSVAYCVDLYVVDSLMTLKYLYLNVAIYLSMEIIPYVADKNPSKYIGKRKSKYAKK